MKKDSVFRGWVLWLAFPVICLALFVFYGMYQSRGTPSELVSHKSRYFNLYYEKGQLSDTNVAAIAEVYDTAYRFACNRLGYNPDTTSASGFRIREYLSVRSKDFVLRSWFSHFGPMEYMDPEEPAPNVTHVMRLAVGVRLGGGLPFLTDGAAGALQAEFSGESPHLRAATLLKVEAGRGIPKILTTDGYRADGAVNSELATSFMAYLAETYGWEKAAEWYRNVTTFERLSGDEFVKTFGRKLRDVETEWRIRLHQLTPPVAEPDRFVRLLRQSRSLHWQLSSAGYSKSHDEIMRLLYRGGQRLQSFRLDDAQLDLDQATRLLERSIRLRTLLNRLPWLLIIAAVFGFAGYRVIARMRRNQAV